MLSANMCENINEGEAIININEIHGYLCEAREKKEMVSMKKILERRLIMLSVRN